MKDRRGRLIHSGQRVVYRTKHNGRVRWVKGEVVTVGTVWAHVLVNERILKIDPEDVQVLS